MRRVSWRAPMAGVAQDALDDGGLHVLPFHVFHGSERIAAHLHGDRVVNNLALSFVAPWLLPCADGIDAAGRNVVAHAAPFSSSTFRN